VRVLSRAMVTSTDRVIGCQSGRSRNGAQRRALENDRIKRALAARLAGARQRC
jgi:hypothetical protein